MKIACTHPGRLGDAIYALPTIRKICNIIKNETGEEIKSDFYTSEYCKPLKRLFEYQNCINKVYIPDNYKIERMDMGVQPFRIPVDLTLYDTVYHMGFRRVPDTNIPDFICESVGLELPVEIKYEYPEFETYEHPYVVLASRGETSYKKLFQDFIKESPITVIQIGTKEDYIGDGINMTGLDLLETTTWIAKSKGFIGLMSSQLCLANGFNIPKIAPHDGIHWDMRHILRSNTNFYPINPTVQELLALLNLEDGL